MQVVVQNEVRRLVPVPSYACFRRTLSPSSVLIRATRFQPAASQSSEMQSHQRQALYWFLVAIAALISVLCFLAAYLHRIGQQSLGPISLKRRALQEQPLLCNGQAHLCDLPANEVVYATAHNGHATIESAFFFLAANHVRELEESLEAGYRGINFDIGICNGEVKLIHGSCIFGVRDIEEVLSNILDFLDRNPNEVLILPTQLTEDQPFFEDDVMISEIDAVFQSVPTWVDKLYQHEGGAWPTLRELIEADTRLIFFPYSQNNQTLSCGTDCPYGFNSWFSYYVETEFSFFLTPFKLFWDKEYACKITRGSAGTKDFFGVNVFVTPPLSVFPWFVNSATVLRGHLSACSALNGGIGVNVLLVDYWGIGGALDVVYEMNAALAGKVFAGEGVSAVDGT